MQQFMQERIWELNVTIYTIADLWKTELNATIAAKMYLQTTELNAIIYTKGLRTTMLT